MEASPPVQLSPSQLYFLPDSGEPLEPVSPHPLIDSPPVIPSEPVPSNLMPSPSLDAIVASRGMLLLPPPALRHRQEQLDEDNSDFDGFREPGLFPSDSSAPSSMHSFSKSLAPSNPPSRIGAPPLSAQSLKSEENSDLDGFGEPSFFPSDSSAPSSMQSLPRSSAPSNPPSRAVAPPSSSFSTSRVVAPPSSLFTSRVVAPPPSAATSRAGSAEDVTYSPAQFSTPLDFSDELNLHKLASLNLSDSPTSPSVKTHISISAPPTFNYAQGPRSPSRKSPTPTPAELAEYELKGEEDEEDWDKLLGFEPISFVSTSSAPSSRPLPSTLNDADKLMLATIEEDDSVYMDLCESLNSDPNRAEKDLDAMQLDDKELTILANKFLIESSYIRFVLKIALKIADSKLQSNTIGLALEKAIELDLHGFQNNRIWNVLPSTPSFDNLYYELAVKFAKNEKTRDLVHRLKLKITDPDLVGLASQL